MQIKKENKREKYIILFTAIAVIFTLSTISSLKEHQTIEKTSSSTLSNTKIGWGIKRMDNHEQPDVGSTNKKLLEENNGICLGSNEKNYIYLTFDLGYEAGYTESILDSLKEQGVSATFFITAHYLNTAEDLVKRMIDEGHIVGNHTPKSLMSGNYKIAKL